MQRDDRLPRSRQHHCRRKTRAKGECHFHRSKEDRGCSSSQAVERYGRHQRKRTRRDQARQGFYSSSQSHRGADTESSAASENGAATRISRQHVRGGS